MIRKVQQGQQGDAVQLMRGAERPILPPLDEYRPPTTNSEDDGSE
jgi:hypothetical protein